MSRTVRATRRAEAPLPLIVAGAAALTAILVVIGGAFTRSGDTQAQPAETRYIQSLEGVVATYGQRGPAATSRSDSVASGSSRSSRSDPGTMPRVKGGLHERLLASMSSSDVMIRRLGHPDGDFIYSKTRGWLRFDNATLSLQPVLWSELPADLKARYPQEIFSDRGRTGSSTAEERAASGGANGSTGSSGSGSGGSSSGGTSSGSGTGPGGRGGRSVSDAPGAQATLPIGEVAFVTTPKVNPDIPR